MVAADLIGGGWNVAFGFADTTSSSAAPFLDGTPPRQCQLIGVSVPFEDTYHHIPRMLRYCELSVYAACRDEDEPIVVGGGMAMINPMPLAPFFDAIIIGDGRDVLRRVAALVTDARHHRRRRRDILVALSRLDHVFVPALYRFDYDPLGNVTEMAVADGASAEIHPHRPPNLSTNPIHSIWTSPRACYPDRDYYSVMVSMGCHQTCPFCVVGHTQGDASGRAINTTVDTILALAHRRRDTYGTNLVKLFFASSFASRGEQGPFDLKTVLRALLAGGFGYRVGSLNLRQADPELLKLLRRGGQSRVTFAPETAEGLRASIGKSYSHDETLIQTAKTAASLGLGLNLYTMLGVPGEQPAHRRELAALISHISKIMGTKQTLHVSVNPMFCKAQTPYERHATLRPETARQYYTALRSHVAAHSRGDQVRWVSVIEDALAYHQPILALGGPELAPVLTRLSNRYRPSEAAWRTAISQLVTGGDARYFRARDDHERLAWQHIVVNDHQRLTHRLRAGPHHAVGEHQA
jgi:radical SAM superfamily enzyme YgiQ (UPF0313 family)